MRPDLFTHTINQLRYGQTAEELSEHMHQCVERAQETGKMAEMTIKLKIKPQARGAQVFIADEIKTKLPSFPREETILFPTPEGNLQRDDPRQTMLPGIKKADEEANEGFKTAQS